MATGGRGRRPGRHRRPVRFIRIVAKFPPPDPSASVGTRSPRADLDHRAIGLLGVLTICAYGSWYYSFGVLLDPIIADTGWREGTLTASFSAGVVVIGVMALAGGRMLDRVGHRSVFGAGAVLVPIGLGLASATDRVEVFFVSSALGMGAAGALGFYHLTMAVAVQVHDRDSSSGRGSQGDRAIAVLTIWGAFASAIFLPATAWLEARWGWRVTTRVLAVVTAVAFALAAMAIPAGSARVAASGTPPLRAVVSGALARRDTRLFAAAVALGGISMQTLLVYQVPVMASLGLAAATASTVAGFRGMCQLLGRLPITAILTRLGIDRSLAVAFAAMTIGGVTLIASGSIVPAVIFAIVAGFGIGAFSPLQGMKAAGMFNRDELGAAMGFYGTVLVLAGSLGPLVAGAVVDATGERRWAVAMIASTALAALGCILTIAHDH